MEQLILIVHVLAALAIIGLILLQQGKGAEAGASFGAGASQTVFGSSGGGNFFTKMTAIFATIFFITSFGLAIVAKNKSEMAATNDIPAVLEVPAQELQKESEIPVVEEAESVVESALPEVEAGVEESSVPASE